MRRPAGAYRRSGVPLSEQHQATLRQLFVVHSTSKLAVLLRMARETVLCAQNGGTLMPHTRQRLELAIDREAKRLAEKASR